MTTTEKWFEWLNDRRKARRAMHFLGSLSSLEQVDIQVVEQKLLSHDSKEVFGALTALACLADVGWKPSRVRPVLSDHLRNYRANAIRASALDVLSRSTDGDVLRTTLRDGLGDTSDEVRALAVREIERHGLQQEPTIRAALTALLPKEPTDYVRGLVESVLSNPTSSV